MLTDTDGVGEVFQDGLVTGSFGDDSLDLGPVGEQEVSGWSVGLARFAVVGQRVTGNAGTFEAAQSVGALLATATLLRTLVYIYNIFFFFKNIIKFFN